MVFSQASECVQLVFGVKKVDPSEHTYVLVPTLGLTWDAMLSDGQSVPKAGLLVMFLAVILLEGECASEQEVWEVLSVMGVYAGKQHCICGEPRELLTKVWVQEGYLEYWQVPHSDPTHSLQVPLGFPGPCGDQQMAGPGVCAQGQSMGSQVLPIPVCRGCERGGRGGLSQSSSRAPSRPRPSSSSCGAGREADPPLRV